MTMLQIGAEVAEFSADAYHENEFKTLKLSDFRGKWVIVMFYPADFTFICPTELREMAETYPAIQKAGGEVLSVSTDTKFTHLAWHQSSEAIGGVKFPMLADPSGRICRQFGTYNDVEGDDAQGLAWRATFIIDPDGKLTWYEIHSNDIGRNAQEILRKLQAGVYVRAHPGEVCPASWTEGAETLKPGLDLVGKI